MSSVDTGNAAKKTEDASGDDARRKAAVLAEQLQVLRGSINTAYINQKRMEAELEELKNTTATSVYKQVGRAFILCNRNAFETEVTSARTESEQAVAKYKEIEVALEQRLTKIKA